MAAKRAGLSLVFREKRETQNEEDGWLNCLDLWALISAQVTEKWLPLSYHVARVRMKPERHKLEFLSVWKQWGGQYPSASEV